MPSKSPSIIGIFCGVEKPTNVSEFVKDFTSEMSLLEREGFFFGEQLSYVTPQQEPS